MTRLLTTAVAALLLVGVAPASADHLSAAPGGCVPVETAGTDGPDQLTGSRVVGFGGDDRLTGGTGADCLSGGAGADVLDLGAGDDVAFGRTGADTLLGGDGADTLAGEAGADRVDGGPGDDRVEASDGERDVVECGDGVDVAKVDDLDVVGGCEQVTRLPVERLRTTPSSGSRRTAFLVRWAGSFDVRDECADPAGACDAYGAVLTARTRAPRDGRRCDVRSWTASQPRGASSVRIAWRGKRPPCTGTYRWRLTYVNLRGWADCDRLDEATTPRPGQSDPFDRPAWSGCRAQERIGDVTLRVTRGGRITAG